MVTFEWKDSCVLEHLTSFPRSLYRSTGVVHGLYASTVVAAVTAAVLPLLQPVFVRVCVCIFK